MPAGTCQGETKQRAGPEAEAPRAPRGAEPERSREGRGRAQGGASASEDPLAPPKARGPSPPGTWSAGCWMLLGHSTAWGPGRGAGQGPRGCTCWIRSSLPGLGKRGWAGGPGRGPGRGGGAEDRGGDAGAVPVSASLTWRHLMRAVKLRFLVCETRAGIKPAGEDF